MSRFGLPVQSWRDHADLPRELQHLADAEPIACAAYVLPERDEGSFFMLVDLVGHAAHVTLGTTFDKWFYATMLTKDEEALCDGWIADF
jgi:hypothetical protein